MLCCALRRFGGHAWFLCCLQVAIKDPYWTTNMQGLSAFAWCSFAWSIPCHETIFSFFNYQENNSTNKPGWKLNQIKEIAMKKPTTLTKPHRNYGCLALPSSGFRRGSCSCKHSSRCCPWRNLRPQWPPLLILARCFARTPLPHSSSQSIQE